MYGTIYTWKVSHGLGLDIAMTSLQTTKQYNEQQIMEKTRNAVSC